MSNFLPYMIKLNTAMVGFGRVLGQNKYRRNSMLKHSPTHPKQHIDAIEINELAGIGMLAFIVKRHPSNERTEIKKIV